MIGEALDRLLQAALVDQDGHPVRPVALPGLNESEIAEAEHRLGQSYPAAMRALLGRTRGIDGLLEEIDFAGLLEGQALDDLFPRTATIAHDGYGNFWAVDLARENGRWGPIWFLCHDPAVALFQCDGLAIFLDELARMHSPPHTSLIDDVHEDRVLAVGRTHPCAMSWEEATDAPDPELAAFGKALGERWIVVDARGAEPGMGIAWGRFGPRTELRRHGDLQLFAYRAPEKRGFFGRRRRA